MNPSASDFLPYHITNAEDPALLPNLRKINESDETKEKCLEILRKDLKNVEDIEPCLEDDFLLRFLRVSKFNTSNAFQRVLKYYQQFDITLEALKKVSLPVQRAQSVKYIWISPRRLKNNSALAIAQARNLDYNKITLAERIYLDMLAVNGALENPVTQITGFTAVFDFRGFNIHAALVHTPFWCKIFMDTITKAFPAKINAAHIVNPPTIFWAVFKIMRPFIPKKIQDRLFMHSSDGWESLHSSIPPEVLPEEYGGKLKFDSFINALENIEELDEHFRKFLRFGYIKNKASRLCFRPICKKK
ncbi:clavesin-2-like [Argiope bruennichi]|nr:clavesin-2-like [Argiope bruennichi]XP_055944882.1 clavesin-2-like [Argiope bruennichi]XP_055944883.1 clavesin-2-like [Argiope bruennichi]XP_055944884.1 clavesin-2-like [Argiope bruennichi]